MYVEHGNKACTQEVCCCFGAAVSDGRAVPTRVRAGSPRPTARERAADPPGRAMCRRRILARLRGGVESWTKRLGGRRLYAVFRVRSLRTRTRSATCVRVQSVALRTTGALPKPCVMSAIERGRAGNPLPRRNQPTLIPACLPKPHPRNLSFSQSRSSAGV